MIEAEPSPGTGVEEALPRVSPLQRERLLTDLLRRVSRSFYLTLRVLPAGLRGPVGLAYLLARAADTIADTRILPPAERLSHLRAFRAQVTGPAEGRAIREIQQALIERQSTRDERELRSSLPDAFSMLEGASGDDAGRIRSVVERLTLGMEIDLTTFPPEDSGRVGAFQDEADLDRYIYYVAGCVGEFWTGITMAHTPALQRWDAGRMREVGVRFGKALQLTNVLRDVPKDLRIGRCYLPESDLAGAGMTPEGLLEPPNGSKARPVLAAWIEKALDHYRAAEDYLLAIPRRCVRLRLGALWPILIGLATLAELARNEAWLDPARPSKVSRGWVYRMVALSLAAAPSDPLMRSWIRRLRQRVEEALST